MKEQDMDRHFDILENLITQKIMATNVYEEAALNGQIRHAIIRIFNEGQTFRMKTFEQHGIQDTKR